MNLIFYQKVDPNDPASNDAVRRNRNYANKRGLRLFEHRGDGVFETVLQEMKVDDECEGAVVLAEHERLTVDGLERILDGCSYLASVISGRRTSNKRGFYFFRKDEEGLAKLETFAAIKKSDVPTKGNEDGNSYGNEGDQRERVESVARERVSPAPGSAPPESKEPKKTKTTKSKKKQKTE